MTLLEEREQGIHGKLKKHEEWMRGKRREMQTITDEMDTLRAELKEQKDTNRTMMEEIVRMKRILCTSEQEKGNTREENTQRTGQ